MEAYFVAGGGDISIRRPSCLEQWHTAVMYTYSSVYLVLSNWMSYHY